MEAKYSEYFGGWLAIKHGKVVKTRDRKIKVFRTREDAETAAAKSKMGFGIR